MKKEQIGDCVRVEESCLAERSLEPTLLGFLLYVIRCY